MKKVLALLLSLLFVFSMTGVSLALVEDGGGTGNTAIVSQGVLFPTQVNSAYASSGKAIGIGNVGINYVNSPTIIGLPVFPGPIEEVSTNQTDGNHIGVPSGNTFILNYGTAKAKSGDANAINFGSNVIVQKANVSQTTKGYSYNKSSKYKKKIPVPTTRR